MYLLDTNVISELRRRTTADVNVQGWADRTPVAQCFLSVITMHEIQLGALLKARKDGPQGAQLHAWIDDDILPRFDGRILPIDTAIALRSAALHVPDPRPQVDAFIAATALVHGMTLVTRNVVDFERTGIEVINPWEVQC